MSTSGPPPNPGAVLAGGYGLQRELLITAGRDAQGWPRFHQFPNAWELYEITGHIDVDGLLEACRRALAEVDLFDHRFGPWAAPSAAGRAEPASVEIQRLRPGLTEPQLLEQVRAIITEPVFTLGDLSLGARPTARLITTGGPVNYLLLCADHTLCDGYSLIVLLRRISAHYSSGQGARDPGGAAEPPRAPSSLALLTSNYQDPAQREDLRDFFSPFRDGTPPLSLPQASQLHWRERFADQFSVFDVAPPTVAALKQYAGRLEVSLASIVLACLQFAVSAWDDVPIPVVYSRLGRDSARLLRAVGPFYETVLTGSGDFTADDLDSWLLAQTDPGRACPALRGSWLVDFVEMEQLAVWRGVSFNFLYPSKPVPMAQARAVSAGAPLVFGLVPPPRPVKIQKPNAIHLTACENTAGGLDMWLASDRQIVRAPSRLAAAICHTLALVGRPMPLSAARSAVRRAWHEAGEQ